MPHDWQQISENHGPLVWSAIYRILQSHSESLDCFQDVMLEAFQKSKTEAIENWAGYLKWMAVRRAIDRLRKNKRNRRFVDPNQDIETVASNSNSPDTSFQMEELLQRLRIELAQMPNRQAEAFWLRFVEQMSYSEIAQQMGIESNSVGVLIHRGRAQMRDALADLQPNEL